MAAHVARPVIFPLSNPTSRARRRRRTSTPGPKAARSSAPAARFPPVVRDGKPFTVDQTNNSYIFPGVGLGVLAVERGA